MFRFNIYNRFFATIKKNIKNLYQILELPTTAHQKDVKSNFLKLAKIYHPDVYKGNDKQRFTKIKQAYEVLSNMQKRREYDISIGLTKQQTEANPKQSNTEETPFQKQTEQKKGPKIDLDYSTIDTESIKNIDQEYQKFFGKKIKTQFEEIRMFEQPEFKQMTEEQRVRRRFSEIYNQPIDSIKRLHQQTFEKILDDQIQMANEQIKQKQYEQRQFEYRQTKQYQKKIKRRMMIAATIGAIIVLPIVASVSTRMRQQREADQFAMENIKKVQEKLQLQSIKQRMKY